MENSPITVLRKQATRRVRFIDQIKRPVWIFTEAFCLPHFTLSASLRREAAL